MGGAAMYGESVPSDRPSLANSQRSGDEAAPFASLPHVRWDPCHPARSLRCRSARCSCVLTHSARASHLELRSRCCEAAPFASSPHVRTSWRPCAMIHVQCTLVNEQCTRKQGDVPPLRCVTLLANITLFYKEARTRATRYAHCVTVLAFVIITLCGSMDTCHALRALCHDPCIADQRCKVARTRAARFAHCVTVLASSMIYGQGASDNEHCHIGH